VLIPELRGNSKLCGQVNGSGRIRNARISSGDSRAVAACLPGKSLN